MLEIPESIIPKAIPSYSIIGTTTKSLEDEIGLPKGIPVIAGEMDSITSIIGTGITKNNKNTFTKMNPLVFLPYIEGERSPIWDSRAIGIFFGLNSQHTRFDFYRAILEGIGFSILQNFEILRGISDKDNIPDYLRVSGGGAENNLLNQIKADILGKKVVKTKVIESGLLGGAILAMMGLKIYSFNEAEKKWYI